MAKQVKVHDHEKPTGWSDQSVDFINKLLLRKQYLRLGQDKPGIAKSHPWFDGFDWDALEHKRMASPFAGVVCLNLLNLFIILF